MNHGKRDELNKVLGKLFKIMILNGTEGRTRTDTVLPPPDFESGASTSFATSARSMN